MYFFGLSVAAANLIGYFLGLFLSYGLNRRWTFAHNEPAPHKLNRWILVAALAYGVNLGIVLAVHRIGKVDAYLAQPLGIFAYSIVLFLGSRHYVFVKANPCPRVGL